MLCLWLELKKEALQISRNWLVDFFRQKLFETVYKDFATGCPIIGNNRI